MEGCARESVLLGHHPQRSIVNNPSSFPNSLYRNSDVEFNDVFGGPPRRYSLQELRHSFSETTESEALRSDDDGVLTVRRWSGESEKPVFGDESVNRRKYPVNDFFDDIFRGNEYLSSSPRKNDRDPFSFMSGACLSPARSVSPRTEPYGSPLHFSLPAKLIRETDLPTFGSSARYYSASLLSRSSSQNNQGQEELRNDVYGQSSLFSEISRSSSEESSNLRKSDAADKGNNLKEGSSTPELLPNGGKFHFSIYKWASKGVPVPLRGGNKSRQRDKRKLQRCSSANGWIACEGMARESPTAASNDMDILSFSSRMPSADIDGELGDTW